MLDGGPGRVRGFHLDLPQTVTSGCLPVGVPLPATQEFVLHRDPAAAVPGGSRLDAVDADCPRDDEAPRVTGRFVGAPAVRGAT